MFFDSDDIRQQHELPLHYAIYGANSLGMIKFFLAPDMIDPSSPADSSECLPLLEHCSCDDPISYSYEIQAELNVIPFLIKKAINMHLPTTHSTIRCLFPSFDKNHTQQ